MKSILNILGAAMLATVIWQVWPEPPITNYPSSGTSVVAFGDSLVAGVGATVGDGFVSRVETKVGVPIVNLGVPGETTADGLARVDDVLEHDPKVVLLLLGGNDAIRNMSTTETRANLAAMIEAFHANGSVVVLLGVRGGLLGDGGFAEMYEGLAKEYNTAFVPDVLSSVFGRPNLMADPIHPNDAGYEKISERIVPVLESVL